MPNSSHPLRIIVTGFEPFGGAASNASWEAVRTLQNVDTVLLPVSYIRAPETVRALIASAPDAILCVGEAGGRASLSIERVAINLRDARIPDNDGQLLQDAPILPGGPTAYLSTLPTRQITEALRASNIPAELSYTAGTYVCNTVFYTLMNAISRQQRPIAGGFIHVPAHALDPDQLRRGLEIAIDCIRAAQIAP